MDQIKPYLKSLVGGLTAGISFAIPVVDDGVLPSEGLGIALAFIGGLGVVYAVPNSTYKAKHDDSQRA